MSHQRTYVSATALVLTVMAAVWPFLAQDLPPAPRTPDLLGIYTGMPANAARAQLQKHSATINVRSESVAELGFGLTIPDPNNRDMITVSLTQPPNESLVWMIQRSQVPSPQNPMSRMALLDALHQKYGKETMTWDKGGGGLFIYWIYDQSGRLLPAADQNLQGCIQLPVAQFRNYIQQGLPQSLNDNEKRCYASFFAVTAALNLKGDLLESYNVVLVNLPFAYRAAMNTSNAKNAEANRARQEQTNRANQNKPTF
jgi:hypothetical protein